MLTIFIIDKQCRKYYGDCKLHEPILILSILDISQIIPLYVSCIVEESFAYISFLEILTLMENSCTQHS